MSNDKMLALSVALVGMLIIAVSINASPLHKGQAVAGTWTTSKFNGDDNRHNNGVCRSRWLLPFHYSKDKHQRRLLSLRFKECLKRETDKRRKKVKTK